MQVETKAVKAQPGQKCGECVTAYYSFPQAAELELFGSRRSPAVSLCGV
jgi:hypothetical protein